MKRFVPHLFSALIGAMLMAVFTLGQALATTGCFPDTNGHWAETFICWLKDRGITSGYPDGTYKPGNYVTRAEMAVFLQKQAQIPPESGQVVINVGPEAWRVNGGSTEPFVLYYANSAILKTSASGTYGYQAGISAPSVLYGRSMRFKSVILCYTASANAMLNSVDVMAFQSNNGNGSVYASASDNTPRTDAICRTYDISSPQRALPGDHFSIYITVSFASGSDTFLVSSTSFIFEPTTNTWPLGPQPLRPSLPEPVPGSYTGE